MILLLLNNNPEYVNSLDFELAIRVINKLYEDKMSTKLWEQWLAIYPNMTKESFISFEDFKNSCIVKPTVTSVKSKADILAEVARIRKGVII